MDVIVDELIIEEDRPEHIARHNVIVEEVNEVISAKHVFIKGREDKWLLIGKTKNNRMLTIVIGERKKKGVFGLVTARPASREERSFYQEFTTQIGGDEYGQNHES